MPRARKAAKKAPAKKTRTPAPPKPSPADDRHERFAQEYLIDLNATGAYRRVYGVEDPSAAVLGHHLLRNVKVAARIAELKAERVERIHLEQDIPIRALLAIIRADVRKIYDADGKLLPLTKWPDELIDAVAGVKIKYFPGTEYAEEHHVLEFKLSERNSAIRTFMQHGGQLTEKHELTGKNGTPLANGAVIVLPSNGRDG